MYNDVTLIGRIGKDIELKQVGTSELASFSLATTSKSKDGKENVQWHRCTVWGNQAKVMSQYGGKGKLIFAKGEIRYSEKDGKYFTNINIHTFRFLNSKNEEQDPKPEAKQDIAMDFDEIPF